jgi:MSHA biogenesis protein MshP
MTRRPRQSGFAYIAAVVLLVVVATVCVALVRLSTTQQNTVNGALLGARAGLAARAGIEWGFYQLRSGGCTSTTLTDFVGDTGFRVTVRCTMRDLNEGESSAGVAVAKKIVQIEAFACNGDADCPTNNAAMLAHPDYVERRRVATTCFLVAGGPC